MALTDTSRRDALKLLGTGAALAAFGTGTAVAEEDGGPLFEFDRMVGNDVTGADGAIRGIDAGGLPWVVDEAEVKLDEDGTLEVEVEGLVIDPEVDNDVAGTNPVPQFRAILSCLKPNDDENDHVVENLKTGTVDASEDGDAEIEEELDLPDTCLAPIVFVTSPGGSWFAVTGF